MKSRQSQNARVLKWLLSGKTLTAEQAKQKWGISRLAARIYDIEFTVKPGGAIGAWPSDWYNVRRDLIYVRNRDGQRG